MIKFKYLLNIFFFIIILNTNVLAEKKIVYFDIDYIISNCNIGKSILKKLKNDEDIKIAEFKEKEKNLKDEENKILASKNIVSENAFKEKILEFQNKIKIYEDLRSKEIEILKKKRNEEISKLLDQINPIIQEFMKKNSIGIVIDKKNIFIADKNYDITDDLINEINLIK